MKSEHKLMAGDTGPHELTSYSVGGGFIEWKDRRLDFDTTVNAMALTAKHMNTKDKEPRTAAWPSPWCCVSPVTR